LTFLILITINNNNKSKDFLIFAFAPVAETAVRFYAPTGEVDFL